MSLIGAYNSAAALIKSIKSKNVGLFKYINVWNDQVVDMISGQSYSLRTPACFIEIDLGDAAMIGNGVSTYPNCIIRFRLVSVVLNDGDNMERNFEALTLREAVKSLLIGSNIEDCSSMQMLEDKQDFNHGNTYVYLLGFKTEFRDFTGSMFDPNKGFWDTIEGFTIVLPDLPYVSPDENEEYEYSYENK